MFKKGPSAFIFRGKKASVHTAIPASLRLITHCFGIAARELGFHSRSSAPFPCFHASGRLSSGSARKKRIPINYSIKMPYKLIIDMFSGRPNPSLVLRYAELRILFNKISIGSIKRRTENSEPLPSMLDYRGMILERNGRRISADLQERIQFTPGYAYMHDTIVETDSLPVIEHLPLNASTLFKGREE